MSFTSPTPANKPSQQAKSHRRWLLAVGAALLVCILLVIAAWAILISLPGRFPDFIVYWLGGNFLIRGENPYNNALWVQEVGDSAWLFFYPMPLAVLFMPWGMMQLDPAYAYWMFFSLVCILSGVLLLLASWRCPRPAAFLPVILAGTLIFRPAIVSIRNGQIGGLFLFLLSLVVMLWERGQWALGGAAAGLLMLKPNIGAPILAIMGLYLLVQRKWRAIIAIVGVNLFLFFLGWIFDPHWVAHFLANGNQKLDDVFGISPTLWGAAHLACGNQLSCTLPAGAAASILLVAVMLYIVYRLKPRSAYAVSLAISAGLLVTPYGWAYEQVLLLAPIVIGMGTMAEQRKPFLITSMSILVFSIIALLLLGLAVAVGHDVASLLVPVLCLAFTLWAIYQEKK